MTRPVTLPPDLEAFADARVEAGDYASVDEVVRAGIDLLREHAETRARLNAMIDEGYRSMEGGKPYSVEEAFAEIDLMIAEAERNPPARWALSWSPARSP